jgi:hypothetical protein
MKKVLLLIISVGLIFSASLFIVIVKSKADKNNEQIHSFLYKRLTLEYVKVKSTFKYYLWKMQGEKINRYEPQIKLQVKSNWRDINNDRLIYIAYPDIPAPNDGYPAIIWLSFIGQKGKFIGWGKFDGLEGGIWNESNPFSGPLENIQKVMRGALNSGVAIITIGNLSSWFYIDCDETPLKFSDASNPDNLCFDNGQNPDSLILSNVFDKIHKGVIKDIDYDRIGWFGYSAGAQFVSHIIEKTPYLTTLDGNEYPIPRFAILSGGGSYGCYSYGYTGNDKDLVPPNFLPCKDKKLGCCPHNYAEKSFGYSFHKHNGDVFDMRRGTRPIESHPPTLLLQTSNDNYADQNASKFYYKSLKSLQKEKFINIYLNDFPGPPKEILGYKHGLVLENVKPTIRFISNFK